MRATYSASTFGVFTTLSFCQGFKMVLGQAPADGLTRQTVMVGQLDHRASQQVSSVQRARPSGGLEQAVATSRASSLLVSLRSAPARGSSFRAASRLPSTKRRLVR